MALAVVLTGEHVGLCARCVHVRVVENKRGSRFYRCLLADTDPRFVKYPRLPVLNCEGFAADTSASGVADDR